MLKLGPITAALLLLAGSAAAQATKVKPISVTGSGAYTPYANAFDGNFNNYWTAPGFAPQWIDIDIGRPINLRKLRLLTSQSPAGNTTHEVYVSNVAPSLPGATLRKLWTIGDKTSGTYTTDNQWLEREGDADDGSAIGAVRYLRILTSRSPSWIGWRELEIYPGVERSGFFNGEADGQAQGDPTIATKAIGSNFTMVASNNLAFIDSKLSEAQANGMKVVLNLAGQLFDGMFDVAGNFKGIPLRLRSDYQAQLDAVATYVNKYPGVVVAVYPYDEPYTVGLSALKIAYPSSQATTELANIKAQLDLARQALNLRFPGVAIASSATRDPIDLDRTADYFAMFDWLGYDCYDTWSNCGGDMTPARFRSKLSRAQQRLFGVPKAFLVAQATTGSVPNESADKAIDSIDNWNRLMLADGRYVAAFPFLWNSVPEGGHVMSGSKDQALVQKRISQFQYSVLGTNVSVVGWAVAPDFSLAPTQRRVLPIGSRASSTYSSYWPFQAIDGDTTSYWTSSALPTANAPQWIEFNLGGSTRVNSIDLLMTQSPSGYTEHYLYAGTLDSSRAICTLGSQPFASFKGNTSDGQVLQWRGAVDAECVRVQTTVSPSWVGLVEIKLAQNIPNL